MGRSLWNPRAYVPNKARKAKFKLFLGTTINAVKLRRIKIEFSIIIFGH